MKSAFLALALALIVYSVACTQQGPPSVGLKDFTEFAGVNPNQGPREIAKLFGEPADTTTMNWNYFNSRMSVNVWNGEVHGVTISEPSVARELERRSISDRKLAFLGAKRDEVVKILGAPNDRSPAGSDYEKPSYKFSYNGGEGRVTFYCHSWWNNECRKISVNWLKGEKDQ